MYNRVLNLIKATCQDTVKLISENGVGDLSGASWKKLPFGGAGLDSESYWSPLHLKVGQTQKDEPQKWFILKSWQRWQKGKVPLNDRAAAFDRKWPYQQRKLRHPDTTQPTPDPEKWIKLRNGAFKQKLVGLGLPYNSLELTGKEAVMRKFSEIQKEKRYRRLFGCAP